MNRERIYTFDIAKGIAILFVIPLHALIYKIGRNDPTIFEPIMSRIPPEFLFFLAPVILLSLWGPIFTMITGANVAYGFLKVYQRDPEQSSAYILRRMLAAGLLIFTARIAVFIFEGRVYEDGTFNLLNFKTRYYADTLDSIALTNIIVPVIMLYLINWVRSRKMKESPESESVIIKPRHLYIGLVILTVLWFVFTPVVHALKPYVLAVSSRHNWKLLMLLYGKMTAGRFRLFPILGFGYVGAIIGVALQSKEKFSNILRYSGLFFGVTLVGFIIWCLLAAHPIGNVASDDIPIMLQVLVLGSMTFALILVLGRVDYCPAERRERRIQRTLFVRRFSIVTLTIYIMESAPAHGIYLIFEQYWETAVQYVDQVPVLTWGLTQILVYISVVTLIWIVIVRLWEKIDFVGSLEWITLKLGALLRGQRKARINSKWILYGQADDSGSLKVETSNP